MGIKHAVHKSPSDKGYASDWNANHVIDADIDIDGNKIINLDTPTANYDASTKKYVDDGLSGKENTIGWTTEKVANKSTDTSLGTSNTLYPSQNAVKQYVDTHTPSGGGDVTIEELLEQSIEIIEIQANGSLTPLTKTDVISETASDSTGYNNMINLTGTTATFSTNKYTRQVSTVVETAWYTGDSVLTDSGSSPQITLTAGIGQAYETVSMKLGTGCFKFNGNVNSAYVIPYNAKFLIGTGEYAMAFWFKGSTGNQFLISNYTADVGSWDMLINTNGKVIYFEEGSGGGSITSATNVCDGNFHHIIINRQNDGKTYMYIDGSSEGTPFNSTCDIKAHDDIYIGKSYSNTSPVANGTLIDDLRFYVGLGLTLGQISTLWNNGNGTTASLGGEADGEIEIDLATISGTVTHTEMMCRTPDRESGDSVTYRLENATQNDDNQPLATKNALVNLTSNPTKAFIKLTRKSASPSSGVPSWRTMSMRVWKT